MKTTRPIHPERFKDRAQNIQRSIAFPLVPVMAAQQFWSLLRAYYGDSRRALWAIARQEIRLWLYDRWWSCLLWITDTIGWTKLYDVSETPDYIAHQWRHGWKCSGSPNCDDEHCISRSLPTWFKTLTRWHAND